MPEIQALSQPLLVGVLPHDLRFEGDIFRDDRGEEVAVRQAIAVFPERFKDGRGQRTVFDDLAQPAPHFPRRERGKEGGIGEHDLGLTERADQVFDARKVHRGLSADGGIHLREEGRRDLNAVDAPHIERGGKSADIPHDAAAQRDEACAAVKLRLRHCAEEF